MMQSAPLALTDFYMSHRGAVTALLLRKMLRALWPSHEIEGKFILGFGYCSPYLKLWRAGAYRCINLSPERVHAARFPSGLPSLAAQADEVRLPLPDACCDRILLVHGLEFAGNAARFLRELWRILKDDGRLLIVVPNRGGLWARAEGTPFGQGQPYSFRQLEHRLSEGLFQVDRRDYAMFVPPLRSRLLLRTAGLWETVGHTIIPNAGGLTLCEATKNAFAAVPAHPVMRRSVTTAEAQ